MLLPERQAEMRELATALTDGSRDRKFVITRIRQLIKFEEKSAEGSQATIDRSEHAHVKKSGLAALRNREATIEHLRNAMAALRDRQSPEIAAGYLVEAANAGGKKSVKAARKAPTVALYVQYLAETDPDFQSWLATQGVRV